MGEVVELRTRHAIGLPDGPQQDMPLPNILVLEAQSSAPPYSFCSPLAVKIAAIRGTTTLNRRRSRRLGSMKESSACGRKRPQSARTWRAHSTMDSAT